MAPLVHREELVHPVQLEALEVLEEPAPRDRPGRLGQLDKQV